VISGMAIASYLVTVTFEQLYAHTFHLHLGKRSDPQQRGGSVTYEIAVPF